MKRWSARQLFAIFFAVFVTAGMSLSVVHASQMTSKTAMGSGVSLSGNDGCQDCPSGGNGVPAKSCITTCVTPILSVLPEVAPAILVRESISFAARYPLLHGRTSSPEPYPPKTTDIG
jgi:hypothetical protein